MLKAECLPPASATCTDQFSSTTAADGTVTRTEKICFSDGSKDLETVTTPPVNGSSTRVVQIQGPDGTVCSTSTSTSSRGADAAHNTVDTTNEVVQGPTGELLATIVTTSTHLDTGATSYAATITCAGQSPEPFVANCLYGPAVSCGTGTCP